MRTGVVVGRAKGVWEELAAARALVTFDETLVVGKVGTDFPDQVDHWVTFHTNLLDKWSETRAKRGYPPAQNYWGAIYKGRPLNQNTTKTLQLVECNGGSSGLVATMVAVKARQLDKVILVGIPMDASQGHYDEDGDWTEANKYFSTWNEVADLLKGRVRSMSGRTRELLGAPTPEWLDAPTD